MITLIFDAPCTYLSGDGRPTSVLQAPLGASTVLDHLAGLAAKVNGGAVRILPPAGADEGYCSELDQLAGARASLCPPGELGKVLGRLEPSDWILLLNPKCWPIRGLDLATFTSEQSRHFGAWYAVPMGAVRDGAEERVHCDEEGRVQSIRRYYDQVTRLEGHGGGMPCALVKAAAVRTEDLTSIHTLRVALATRGVPSRDVPVQTDLVDLADERGLLAVNERFLNTTAAADLPPGYSQVERAVICGRGALIHHTATIVPPVVIQSGVLIEENATIIGPTVIGAGSTIQKDALIAQSVVPAGSVVPAAARVRHSAGPLLEPAPDVCEDHDDGEAYEPRLLESEGEDVDARVVLPPADTLHHRRGFLAAKRIVDSTLSGIALIVLSPLLLVIAILVKLDSRGPVFFKHRREQAGGGREFKCYKFRTMRADAHQLQRQLAEKSHVDGPHFKIENDPRVTRLGRFLRATNLDELPQFFNVLRGDMSLVGPRPSPFRENQVCIPWRRARLSVRPGITGLWQICRNDRGEGDFQQWIFYDIMYVRNLSAWLDIKIFIATILSLGGRWPVPLHWLIRQRHGENGWSTPRRKLTARRSGGTRVDSMSVGR